MKTIPVAVLHECFVCHDDGRLAWKKRPLSHFRNAAYQRRWNVRYEGTEAGSPNGRGALKVHVRLSTKGPRGSTCFLVHRVVWAMRTGAWPDALIDHINGDQSDNSVSNLRVATLRENGWNMPAMRNNTSGFKGVSRNRGRWMASMRLHGKKKNLGRFNTPEEAHAAYVAAAKAHHGEFACTELRR